MERLKDYKNLFMKNKQIIEHYAGYVEIIISEGNKLTLEEAVNYAYEMFKEDTTRRKNCRANRFIGGEKLKHELKKRFIEIGLK